MATHQPVSCLLERSVSSSCVESKQDTESAHESSLISGLEEIEVQDVETSVSPEVPCAFPAPLGSSIHGPQYALRLELSLTVISQTFNSILL